MAIWNGYLKLHPEEEEEILQLKQLLRAAAIASRDIEMEEQLGRLKVKLGQRDNVFSRRRRIIGVAVAAVVVAIIGIWSYRAVAVTEEPVLSSIYVTEKAQRKTLTLEDGTTVVLNAGSELEVSFSLTERTVHLKGEAFFDVTHDADRPFFVNTERINLKVLGTAFNVKDYPEDKRAETSLIRGSVELKEVNRNSVVLLKPNQKYVSRSKELPAGKQEIGERKEIVSGVLPVKIDSTIATEEEQRVVETSWTRDRLVFADEPLDNIARTLERWYGVSIQLNEEGLAKKIYTASFKGEQLKDVLEALKFSNPFNYTIKNDTIMITR